MQPAQEVILDHGDLLETQAMTILETFSSLPWMLQLTGGAWESHQGKKK